MVSVIPWKKVLNPSIRRFTEESIPKLATEGNAMKKISLTKILYWQLVFFRDMLRNGIPSWFLFRVMVWNIIPSVCFYFCFTVQNSKHFSPLRSGSERNSDSFLFRGTAGIPPEQTGCSVNSVFRGIYFLSEIDNPI
jgi:hypothetical protein